MYLHFYKCDVCGQVVAIVKGTGVPIDCCDQEMNLLIPNSEDEELDEKHVPVIKEIKECCNKVTIQVGEKLHPTEKTHFIDWIALKTNKGVYFKNIKPGDRPEVTFMMCPDERVIDVFAFCNLHGLWKYTPKNKY